jgi:cytidylate kinase
MSIVAISETTGSLGNEIGRRVSERLGYRFADREIIAKAAEQFGALVSDLRHGTEEKPSFWERLTDSQHRYRAYVDSIIWEMATGDDVVLTGLAATIVLRQVPHALRVRTSAPERLRADRVEQQQGLTREAALDHVRHTDHERATRVKFLYRVNVDDHLLYDMVLNTERMTADEGARIIQETLKEQRFLTTPAWRRQLIDRSIVARAQASFMASPMFDPERVTVSASGGCASLSGTVDTDEERALVEQTVKKIPGVTRVLNEIVVTPPIKRALTPTG